MKALVVLIVEIFVGVLLAGMLAPLIVVALPSDARGPAIPLGVAILCVAAVLFLRRWPDR